jgi:hypothetical protein
MAMYPLPATKSSAGKSLDRGAKKGAEIWGFRSNPQQNRQNYWKWQGNQ